MALLKLIAFVALLILAGCSASGYTGEAGERWYAWQREEVALVRAIHSGECDTATEKAVDLWYRAIAEDAPRGQISIWTASEILYSVTKHCPAAHDAYRAELDRLEAAVLSGGASEAEVEGWEMLVYWPRDGESVVRVLAAAERDAELGSLLRYPKYRRENLQSLAKGEQRDDLAAVIDAAPVDGMLEGVGDAGFRAVGAVAAPVFGPLFAHK